MSVKFAVLKLFLINIFTSLLECAELAQQEKHDLTTKKTNMKKLKHIKENDLAFKVENSIYCDFCGDEGKKVFTSTFDDSTDSRKCEMQICFDCVSQLNKHIK